MIKGLLAAMLLAILSVQGTCESTILQGNAFYYKDQTIEVHKYLDLFTFKSESISEQIIGEDGSFRFDIDINKTGLYLIKIGKVHAHIFLVPSDQYTVVMPEPIDLDRYNPARDVFVQPEIFETDTRVNFQVTKLEQWINRFFIDNTTESYNLRSGSKIQQIADTFAVELNKEFEKVDSEFFKSYFLFRKAEFELNTRHSRESVYKKYFKENAPNYDQLSFANSFKIFFKDYLTPKSTHRFSDSLEAAISENDIDKILRNLSTDKYLQNTDYRELTTVYGLYELGREQSYSNEIILNLLDSISNRSKNPEIHSLVDNCKEILLKLAPGTRAPDFVFADVVGNLYRISEYEGYFIYIQFFDEFNSESLREMSLMKVLREGYGADIAMFSFSTNESLKRLRDIPNKHDFDWFFGKLGSPDQVRDDYELRALPMYYFLDEELKIVQSPTPPPGAKIEKRFAAIWNKKHPNKAMPFKLQPPPVKAEEPELEDQE